MRHIITFFFLLIISIDLAAQGIDSEFRGTWVASVYNIDWPSTRGDVDLQKEEIMEILDSLKSANMNAALLQIRPTADALYQSSYEPWSEWLTGDRGDEPGYDPLAFAISEAHKRGIELHGWLNPYRFETSSGRYSGKEGDVISENLDWIIDVDDKTYLNPGDPEVTAYLKQVVGDIVENYDIDGLCFDDYFYPAGISTEDAEEYLLFGNEGESVGDFRRRSINQMIAAVYDTIKQVKPWVRFGVSPAGIYSTDPSAAAGHETALPAGITGRDNFNVIYCDPLAWIEQGSLDYLSPQLYWKRGGGQDFNTLIEWWSAECDKNDVDCYPSMGTYRLSGSQPPLSSSDGWDSEEIIAQINVLRNYREKGAQGMVFYSQSDLVRVNGLSEKLKTEVYENINLWPEFIPGAERSNLPVEVSSSTFGREESNPVTSFIWEGGSSNRYWAEGTVVEGVKTFGEITFEESVLLPADTVTSSFKVYSINRFGRVNETFYSVDVPEVGTPEVLTALDEGKLASFESLDWMYTENASVYYIEVSETAEFSAPYYNSGLIRDTSIAVQNLDLEGESEYFLKVFACNGNNCNESAVQSFETGFPSALSIQSPEQGQMYVPVEAEITWSSNEDLLQYNVQVAKDSLFETIEMDSVVENQTSITSLPLEKWTEYHVRIRGVNDYGMGSWSDVVSFRTTTDIPEGPVFLSPEDSVEIDNPVLALEWTKVDFAQGYRLMIAEDTSFATAYLDTVLSRYQRDFDFELPGEGPFFARVCGSYEGGCGAWSDTLRFARTMTNLSRQLLENSFSIFPNPANQLINIKLKKGDDHLLGNMRIEIYDLTGKVVQQAEFYSGNEDFKIDISVLKDGIYCLKVIDVEDFRESVKRFVKM